MQTSIKNISKFDAILAEFWDGFWEDFGFDFEEASGQQKQ